MRVMQSEAAKRLRQKYYWACSFMGIPQAYSVHAKYENLGFRYVSGGIHPDHDTIANFRKTFLKELEDLFVQILMLAKLAGKLKLGNLSLDGSKIHADASKSHAVSYGRLVELETEILAEVGELLVLGERADQGGNPIAGRVCHFR